MARQGTVQERIAQIESSIVAELDQIVELESARLTGLLDTERLYLNAVLEETAREIRLGGERAAARVMRRGWLLADEVRGKDPARADRMEQVAMGCHDQVRSTADTLARRVLEHEQALSAPIHRAKREALTRYLPEQKRPIEELARRGATELRRKLNASGPGAPTAVMDEEVERWRRSLVDGVRLVRTATKERVDLDHKRARGEVERVVEELAGVPPPVRKRLNDVVDPTRIDQLLRTGSEGRAPTPKTRGQRIRENVWAVFVVVFAFGLGTAAMSAGIGVSAALFLALAFRGADAPFVVGGMLIGLTGSAFGAFASDLFFSGTGDWRQSVRVALFGASTPLVGPGRPLPSRDLANTLQYVELPPISPDRVATAAAPGALRVALRASPAEEEPEADAPPAVIEPIRIPSPRASE